MKKILIAYDSSAQSDKAFAFALDLAAKYSAEIVVISVARPPEPPEMVEAEAMIESASDYYNESFAS